MNIQNTNMSLNESIDELIILFKKKEFNSLIEKAKEKIKKFPESFELYNLIGITYADHSYSILSLNGNSINLFWINLFLYNYLK